MAKEEAEEVESVKVPSEDEYILIQPGQRLKAGDQVSLPSDGRWQTMSPTVDGMQLAAGLMVRRKRQRNPARQLYIFLETGDIIQDGDELHYGDKWMNFPPSSLGVPITVYKGLARRKVL